MSKKTTTTTTTNTAITTVKKTKWDYQWQATVRREKAAYATYVEKNYAYVNKLGMRKVLTTMGTGFNIVKSMLETLDITLVDILEPSGVWKHQDADGIILLGGTDIDPWLYNQRPGRWTTPPDYIRDAIELELLIMADHHHLPVLGICRGMQMMAANYGGDLYQDIFDDLLGAFQPTYHKILAQGRLRDIIPSHFVNSLHHQAVKTVPSGFRVVATANDGIIEGIWRPGRLGVQFHPELLFEANWKWFNIFRWFTAGLR